MYFFKNICFICLKSENHLARLINNCENSNYYSKLILLFPEMISTVLHNQGALCAECCNKVDGFYKFRKQCLRNSQTYINYKLQLSSTSETSGDLCIYFTDMKKEQNKSLKNCGTTKNNYSSNNSLTEDNCRRFLPNVTSEKYFNDSYVVISGDDAGANINDESGGDIHFDGSRDSDIKKEIIVETKSEVTDEYIVTAGEEQTSEWENGVIMYDEACGEMHPDDSRESDIVKNENDTETEYAVIDEYIMTAGVEHTADWDNGMNINNEIGCDLHPKDIEDSDYIKKEVHIKTEFVGTDEYVVTAGIEHAEECNNGNIEEMYIKPEPLDTSESEEDDLESSVVSNTESRDIRGTYCIISTDDMPQYNYNTNFIFTEGVGIKSECVKDSTFRESAVGRDTARGASSSNPDEGCVSLVINNRKQSTTSDKSNIYKKTCAPAGSPLQKKRVNSSEKSFKYKKCKKSLSNLVCSNSSKQKYARNKPFKCEFCDKAFGVQKRLVTHKRVHTGDKSAKCDQCNKVFSIASNLARHKQLHSGEKPFKCDQCDKSYARSEHLINHKRTHSGERPFKCRLCDKAFSRSTHLTSHEKLHSGERRFKCDECNKAFSKSSNLSVHKRIHSGEKPFKCDQCDKGFSRSTFLSKHKQIHSVKNLEDHIEVNEIIVP